MTAHDLRVEEAPAPYCVAPLLTDHLDTFASAPEGFKRLRELVLNLAVRGRLVPQVPDDESADKLLERIRKERAALSSRREKAHDPVDDDEVPYMVPSSWRWVRLPEICHDWGQKVPDGPFTYIDVGAIDNERGVITDATQLLDASNAPSRARKIVCPGTVLYSTVRPYLLNIAIVDRSYEPGPIASTAFAVLHPFTGIDGRFLFYYLRSQPFIDFVGSKMVGVAYPAINDSNFFSGLFPLPPTTEQSRIVAKVEELMALIDALEAKVGAGETARGKLLEALLAALAVSPDAAATANAWAQLAPHFDLLLQTPADVDRLQQTLLQLAVKGRLAPQDPKDEPAAALLKRIRAEKERMVTEGKVKRDKPLPAIDEDTIPYELPQSWQWSRLASIGDSFDYGTSQKATEIPQGVPVLRMGNVQAGTVTLTNLKYFEDSQDELPHLYLQPGDLLFNRTNSYELVGKTGIFKGEPQRYSFASYLIRIRANTHAIDPQYLNLYMNSLDCRLTQIEPQIVQQNGQANFNGTKLQNICVPLPPRAEQSRIVAAVASFTALCDHLRERLAARRELSAKLAAALTEGALS